MKSWKVFICSMFVLAFTAWAAVGSAEDIVIGYSGPLSGPAAEYGQDCVNGIDMAINEINAAGGITFKGGKYTFKLEKLDDRIDPTQAVNNANRFVAQYKAPVVFNSIATTTGALLNINQTKGSEFLLAAYSSVHSIHALGNKLLINPTPNFVTYAVAMAGVAWDKGWRNGAMVVTLGAYGDAWRAVFKGIWEKKGGKILADKPANYYTETDFSSQLTAAIAVKPDFILIGGPSATTALVVEQARGMGYKGGFIMIDQAKPDYVSKVLKNDKLLEGLIGLGSPADFPLPITPVFSKKYQIAYKKDMTWECALNYNTMHVVARAMQAADSREPAAIRAAVAKALPTAGDKFPNELFGIADNGVMYCGGLLQTVTNGKFSKVDYIFSFPKSKEEFEKYKKMSKSTEPDHIRYLPLQ